MLFLDIVHDLTRMAEEAFAVPERPIRCVVEGDPGAVPATVAAPLAVVLNELLQNTADHAFPAGQGGKVALSLTHEAELAAGHRRRRRLPDGFDLESSAGLGLSIVRTLVRSELGGSIELRAVAPPGRGAQATIRVPVTGSPEQARLEGVTAERPPGSRTSMGSGGAAPSKNGSAGLALAGDPGPAELATLLLRGAAPHAGVLVGGQGELEAGRLGSQVRAHGLGLGDLLDGRAGGADGEEEVRLVSRQAASSRQFALSTS